MFKKIKQLLFGRKYDSSFIQFSDLDIEYVDDNNFIDVLNNIIQSVTNKIDTLDLTKNTLVSNYNSVLDNIVQYRLKIDHLYTFATTSFFIYIKDMSSILIRDIIDMQHMISKHSHMYLTTCSRKGYEIVISCSLTLEDMINLMNIRINNIGINNLIINIILDTISPYSFNEKLYNDEHHMGYFNNSRPIYFKGQIAPRSKDDNVHIYVLENQLNNIFELEGNIDRLFGYTNEINAILSMMQIVLCYDNIIYSNDILKSNSNTYVSVDKRIICKYNILELYNLIDKLLSIAKLEKNKDSLEELSIIISVLTQIKSNTKNIILNSLKEKESNKTSITDDIISENYDLLNHDYINKFLKNSDDNIDSVDEIL